LSGSHVAPGESPGTLNVGSTTLNAGSNFDVEINGATAGTFDQLNVTGTVTIDTAAPGANLNISLGYTPTEGDFYTIINNDGTDAVTGTFVGQPQRHIFTVGGKRFGILYDTIIGNDVTIYALDNTPARPTIYVDAAWTGLADGTIITDADPVASGNQTKVIGIDAFSTIADGLTALANAAGTDIFVLSGTYSEAVTVPGGDTLHVVGGTPSNPGPVATADGSVTINSLTGGA